MTNLIFFKWSKNFYMIVTFYSHSNNPHNLQVMELIFKKISKHVSKSQNFKSHLPHVKWGVIQMT
jgi:hypothetical protein